MTMRFSILFFTAGEGGAEAGDKYRDIIDCARFADAHGFDAVWVPERHFMTFGALFPTPAILLTAIARETKRIGLRAGSVVLPLHDPVRVAEDWAMLDNLSGGRAGMACASGWQPNDFVLRPGTYRDRQTTIYESIATLRHLWAGGTISRPGDLGGEVAVRLYPTPLQPSLALWVTTAGNPETFRRAGTVGANLLTYLALHDLDGLTAKIALYRQALRDAGHDPARHRVTVWAQVFVGANEANARRQATAALAGYFLTDARSMFSGLAAHHLGRQVDFDGLSAADLAAFGQMLAGRLVDNGMAIFGSPESCVPAIARLRAAGVDELACQLDMGLPAELVRESLPHIVRLRDLCQETVEPGAAVPLVAPAPKAPARDPRPSLPDLLARCGPPMSGAEFYRTLARAGFEYGPAFQGVQRIHRGAGEALALVGQPEIAGQPFAALLDAQIQVLHASLPDGAQGAPFFAGIRHLELSGSAKGPVWVHATTSPNAGADGTLEGEIRLLDESGAELGALAGVQIRTLATETAGDPSPSSYSLRWRPVAAPETPGSARRVLVLAEDAVAARIAGRMRACGHSVVAVPGARVASPEDARRLLAAWAGAPPDSVLFTQLVANDVHSADGSRGLHRALHLTQALADSGWGILPRLWFATEDGDAGAAALCGFARTVAHEVANLRCSMVVVSASGERLEQLADLVVGDIAEAELALRPDGLFARRLTPLPAVPKAESALFRPDGGYIVTGGLGALGLRTAAWMAAQGARHLLLGARSAAKPEAEATLAALREAGTEVATLQADLATAAGVEALFAEAARRMPPLRGLIHAAGVLDDGILAQQNAARFDRVLGPKSGSAWMLHRRSRDLPLDHFVMFSSAAAILGSPAQSNYAAANAALGGLAQYRRTLGLPGLAVAWGAWRDSGMAAQRGTELVARLARQGLRPLAPDAAFAALGRLMRLEEPEVLVIDADWAAYQRQLPHQRVANLLADLVIPDTRPDVPAAWRHADPAARAETLTALLAGIAGEVLGLEAAAIDPEQSLASFGLDSLMAVVLRNRVARDLGAEVPLVRLLDGISVGELVLLIAAQAGESAPPPDPVPFAAATPAQAEELLARLDTLDDATVDALLDQMLAQRTA